MGLAVMVASAQMADLITALNMQRHELNPVAAPLLGDPLAAFLVKASLVVLVVAAMRLQRRRHETVGRLVGVIAVLAGLFGALSNV